MVKKSQRATSPIEAEVLPGIEAPPPSAQRPAPARRATAESMASRQREISVSEFFTKNRHLLGFDNPAKALLTTVKEAVDNSLDACEEGGILPSLLVEIHEVPVKDDGKPGKGDKGEGAERGPSGPSR